MIKKLIFIFFATYFVQAKAAFNTEGLPEGAGAFLYYSHEKFCSTQIGKLLSNALPVKLNRSDLELLKNGNTQKDFKEIILGVYPEKNPGSSSKPLVVALFKGQYNLAKMKSTFAQSKIPEQKINGVSAWDAYDLEQKNEPENKKLPKMKRGEYLLLGFSENCLALCPTALATTTVETLQKKKKSAVLPANLAQIKTNPASDWLIIRSDLQLFKQYPEVSKMMSENGILNATFALGEDSQNLTLQANSDFTDSEKAEVAANQIRGLIGIGMISLPASQKNPEDAEAIKSLFQKIKINQTAKSVEMRVDYPADKAAQMIAKGLNKAMIAAPNQTGVARTETKEESPLDKTP